MIRTILLSASFTLLAAGAFGQSPSALSDRIDADKTFDPQSTIEDWVNPGAASRTPTPGPPQLSPDGKTVVAPVQDEGIKPTFKLVTTMNYDTNAFRKPTDLDDWHLDYAATLGAKLDLGFVVAVPSLVVGGSHYFEFDELSDNRLAFELTVEPKGQDDNFIKVAFTYASEWFFTEGFDDDQGNYHTPAVRLGHVEVLAGELDEKGNPKVKCLTLATNLTGNYQFADDSTRDSTRATLAAKLSYRATEKLTLTASAGETYRNYTNTDESRDIWMFKAGAAAAYEIIAKKLSARVGVSYTDSDDRLDPRDYDQFVTFAGLTLSF